MALDRSLDVADWKPTARHLNVACLLASGDYTLARAAETAGVPLRTVERWNADPRFRALIHGLWREAWDRIAGKVLTTGPDAAAVVAEVIHGRSPADDRYDAARWLLDRLRAGVERAYLGPQDVAEPGAELSVTLRADHAVVAEFLRYLEGQRPASGRSGRIIAGELAGSVPADDPPSG